MSFQLPSHRVKRTAQPRWSGAAVLIESMLLLVFLIASMAIFTQMFAMSLSMAGESSQLTAATAAASDAAEHFAADPTKVAGEQVIDDLLVVCDVQDEAHRAGTLYRAEISVYATDASGAGAGSGAGAEPIYTINTSRFESEVS